MAKQTYDESNIQVLQGLEAVRKRPGMYIGSTDARGLHHLIWEIVDNSIDEVLAGEANHISVVIHKGNSVEVTDNGRGIPIGMHKTGKPTPEVVFCELHAGGKFSADGAYKVSGGLHGVGSSVVNALSEWLELTIQRDKKTYFQRFEKGGKPIGDLTVISSCDNDIHGTEVRFKADATIFTETTEYSYSTLEQRLRELAFLNKGLRIALVDERGEDVKRSNFFYEGGIAEYVLLLNKNKTALHDVVAFEGTKDDISIEVVLQYNEEYNSAIYSFTNNIRTHEGGTHEDGVKAALARIINNYAKNTKLIKDKDESLKQEDVQEGVTMVISCKHPDPQFEGQTKTKLGNSEVRKIASDIFSEGFDRYLMENPDIARTIVSKCVLASQARLAAKKARENTRRKTGLDNINFMGKLTDCKSKNAEECEIFIVEGDSAGGSAKMGRDYMTQAVLPLRGKILNVEKARLDRALNNEEIKSMITAFGTGIGEDFDLEKLRSHKIIIMTYADVDGSHIRTLLLTLFYRFFKPIVEGGFVYAAQPPLYKVTYGKKTVLVQSEEDLPKVLEQIPEKYQNSKIINRFKGLGEMDAVELRDTTMNKNNRVLRRITVEDAMAADEAFSLLMSDNVEPRRNFIVENAGYVKNLDI